MPPKEEREHKKSRWTEIGAAWPHRDGKGLTVVLKALPVNGRVVLMARPKRCLVADQDANDGRLQNS